MEKMDNIIKNHTDSTQNVIIDTSENSPPSPRIKLKTILIITILSSILIAVIITLGVVLTRKDDNKRSFRLHEKKQESTQHIISGTYNTKRGVPLRLFNPSKIGLNEQNYTVKESTSKNNTRRLQELNVIDGIIIPEITGLIQYEIIINESITSLDFLFEGCQDLVKVDLSDLNSTNLTSMIYTFAGCSSLETVNLTNFNTSEVQQMEFFFSGCTNLQNIKGFENLNTSSLSKTAGMFLGCQNLKSVNLSAFQSNNITEKNGMFIDKPSLESLDIGNASDINSIFSSSENYNVRIITTSSEELNMTGLAGSFTTVNRTEYQQLNCTLRNWENLFTKFLNDSIFDIYIYIIKERFLNPELKNEDFYIVYEDYDEITSIIENLDCDSLNYTEYLPYALYNSNFTLCEKYKRFFIEFLNEYEKCTECDTNEGRRMYCNKCNYGYYVPKGIDYEPTKCRRCSEGCEECIPDTETDGSICIKCEKYDFYYYYDYYDDPEYYNYDDDYEPYKLYNGKCIKRCNLGYGNDRCLTCDNNIEKYDQCGTCNAGYYFDENINTTKCLKIEISNCTEARVESGTVRCTKCINGYIVHDNKCVKACDINYLGDNCASCNTTYEFRKNCASCHSGFYLFPEGNKTVCKSCNSSNELCKECEYNYTTRKFIVLNV